jgi:hypothetical protein
MEANATKITVGIYCRDKCEFGVIKNLVTDKPSPITVGLAQKSDADGLFKLMDANVTRGNLKNLVTDKPSLITVGLAQKSDADGLFKLMDAISLTIHAQIFDEKIYRRLY